MNAQHKQLSQDAARFWFEANRFLVNNSLLVESIANQFVNLGHSPEHKGYGLRFGSWDIGESRLVHDRLKNHWYGSFTQTREPNAIIDVYGFGVTYGTTYPEAPAEPWIPLVYFFRASMERGAKWEDWKHQRVMCTPTRLLRLPKEPKRLWMLHASTEDVSGVETFQVIRIPVGAVQSTDDVQLIVGPVIDALIAEDETALVKIKDYLLEGGEQWQ